MNPEPQERVEGERRVADPRVAVVPVAAAAELLGEARGRGGDERARRAVRQELQRQRGTPHDLAPPTLIARCRDPTQPVVDGLVEQLSRVVLRVRPRLVALLEDERRALALIEGEGGADACLRALERDASRERQRQIGRREDRAVVGDGDVRLRAAVVEARLDLGLEVQRALDAEHPAHEPLVVRPLLAVVDRHEVDHLADAVLAEETGDEDVRVRHVELLRRPLALDGREAEEAAALRVEDRAEHAGRVEAAVAVPVDRAVSADERGRVQVADDAVLRDRQVVVSRSVGHAAILRLGSGSSGA